MKILPLFSSLILLSYSCNKWKDDPCKHPAGQKGKIEHSISHFNHLEINQHIPVSIQYSDTPKVIIYGPSESLKFISTAISNDTLRLKNLNRCSWLRNFDPNISIEIFTPELSSIIQNGSADVHILGAFKTPRLFFYTEYYSGNLWIENLSTDSLLAWVNSSGSANFNLNGNCQYAYLFIRGSSQIDARNLETKTAHLVSYSNGNISLKSPKQMIIGEIRYNGNIEVSSRPPNEKMVITGKGKYIYP